MPCKSESIPLLQSMEESPLASDDTCTYHLGTKQVRPTSPASIATAETIHSASTFAEGSPTFGADTQPTVTLLNEDGLRLESVLPVVFAGPTTSISESTREWTSSLLPSVDSDLDALSAVTIRVSSFDSLGLKAKDTEAPFIPILDVHRGQDSILMGEMIAGRGGESAILLFQHNDDEVINDKAHAIDKAIVQHVGMTASAVVVARDQDQCLTTVDQTRLDRILLELSATGVVVLSVQQFMDAVGNHGEIRMKDLLAGFGQRDWYSKSMFLDRKSTPAPADLPVLQRLGLLLVAFLQIVLVGSIWFGWSSVAEDEGRLMTAPVEDGGGGLTLQESTGLFGVAASFSLLSGLPIGFVLDRYGPRACSVFTHSFLLVGCYIFSLDKGRTSYTLLSFGMASMSAGSGITTSVLHVGNLFEQVNLVVAGLSGSSSFSFAILPIFGWIWQQSGNTISVHDLFGYYIYIIMASMVASLVLWPDQPYQQQSCPQDHKEVKIDETEEDVTPVKEESKPLLHDQSLFQQGTSATYARIMLYWVVTFCAANFALAAFPVELAGMAHSSTSSEAAEVLCQTFTVIFSSGILAAFAVGYTIDKFGLVFCTVLSLLVGQVHQLLTMVVMGMMKHQTSHAWLLQGVGGLSFVAYTCFRQFLFPVFVSSLSSYFGLRNFGTLLGFGYVVAGLAQLSLAPLLGIIEEHQALWGAAHWAQIILLGVVLVINGVGNHSASAEDCGTSTAKQNDEGLPTASRRFLSLRTSSDSLTVATSASYGSVDIV